MPTSDSQLLFSEFDAVSLERWLATAGESLDHQTVEGPTVRALYTAAQGEPGPRPPARTPGWRVALEYSARDVAELVAALREDAGRGVERVQVSLHGDLRAGARGPVSHDGSMLEAAQLPELLAALEPGVALQVLAGEAAGALVEALLQARGEAPVRGDAITADPVGTLAQVGGLGRSLDDAYAQLAASTRRAIEAGTGLVTVLADAVPAHDAGASAEQEVAVAVATGLEHLQRLDAQGLSAAQVLPHLALRMACGSDLLIEVAKLRAVRRLWDRVRAHLGASEGPATPLWVRTSWRSATERDPWVNLLRGTVGAFAAVMGGASVLAVQPFTEALGRPRADARRWAINTQHILRGEAHLAAIDDPAAGSFAFEALTDDLARGAWALVRGWLGEGGIAAAVRSGRVQAEIAERAAARAQALATGAAAATGTTTFPRIDEHRPGVEPIPTPGPVRKEAATITAAPLARRRDTEAFEALRDRADAVTLARGARPRALLVPVGPPREARGQIAFARNLAEVGGFEVSQMQPDQTLSERIRLAILCGPPEALQGEGAAGIRRLLAAGVGRVLVAGRPSDEMREAGAHDFVHRGRDVVSLLRALQDDLMPLPREANR